MSTNTRATGEKTYFEQQRELVLQDVATVSLPARNLPAWTWQDVEEREWLLIGLRNQNLEQVLQNMNKLNRSLESVIAVWISTH